MNSIFSSVPFVVVVYALACAFLYFNQKNYIFFPSSDYVLPSRNFGVEEVFFETSDGVKLHGWWMETSGAEKTVLFFHGNAGNLSHRGFQFEIFKKLGVSGFMFDYRGYGKSEGVIKSEEDLYLDGDAAFDFLVMENGVDVGDVVVWGRSVGGAVAADVAVGKNVSAVILESTFFSLDSLARKYFVIFPTSFLLKFHFLSGEKIGGVRAPVLIIHSKDDEIMPFSQGERLFGAAGEPKTFLEISGGHNSGVFESYDFYLEGVGGFLEKI